jgi:hypothetical protein
LGPPPSPLGGSRRGKEKSRRREERDEKKCQARPGQTLLPRGQEPEKQGSRRPSFDFSSLLSARLAPGSRERCPSPWRLSLAAHERWPLSTPSGVEGCLPLTSGFLVCCPCPRLSFTMSHRPSSLKGSDGFGIKLRGNATLSLQVAGPARYQLPGLWLDASDAPVGPLQITREVAGLSLSRKVRAKVSPLRRGAAAADRLV